MAWLQEGVYEARSGGDDADRRMLLSIGIDESDSPDGPVRRQVVGVMSVGRGLWLRVLSSPARS